MSPWDGFNRRQFPRVTYPCLLIIRHGDKEQDALLTHTENIGTGGVCLILKKHLKAFLPVEIELDLLDTKDHIKCNGKVVWSIRRKDTETNKPLFYDTGIEFVDLDQEDHRRLETVISHLVSNLGETSYT